MANRQIARDLGVSPETVTRHINRLGRHCLLFHAKAMQTAPPADHIVLDGLVTFEWSQYYPFHSCRVPSLTIDKPPPAEAYR